MAETPYVSPPRTDAEGRPIETGGRAGYLGDSGNQAEQLRDAVAESDQYAEAHAGLLDQIKEARESARITDDVGLLSAAELKEGEALDANSLLQAAMNTAVARSLQGASERLQEAQRTPAQRLGREVALAIESRVSELEEGTEPVPDFEAEADAQLTEEQEREREADESIAEITSAWEADRREQEAAAEVEDDLDVWLSDDED